MCRKPLELAFLAGFPRSMSMDLLMLLAAIVAVARGNPDAKRLYDDLMSNYNRLIRPVANQTGTITVKLGLRLSQLVDLNLKNQILTTNVWVEQEWNDYKFTWDPSEYGGVTELYVPSEHIWLPDIVLYNNADGDYIVTTMTKAILNHDGTVRWTPPAIFKSSCEINVEFFPFDKQECFLKFGSWTFDGFQVDLKHINGVASNDTVVYGMDLSEYYMNVEWDIIGVPAVRHEKYYPCCPEPFPDIYFNIIIRRKALFYLVNLIIPCVGIFYLTILVFYLPAQSGEKTALVIAIQVSQTLYLNVVIDVIPATSMAVPLLGRYLLFSITLIFVAIALTTIILNLHYRKPSTHKMPPWVRKLFIQRLPKVLMMSVPIQVIENSHRERRSKFLRESDPTLTVSAEEEARTERMSSATGSCNYSFLNHINGLYNGLGNGRSLVKDEREHFVVEKAIHNIMFIKHHMKQQDAFDAEDQDWGIVAMVLDRLFLWVYGVVAFVGSVFILSRSPFLFEDIDPIDILHSRIHNPGTAHQA